MQDARESNRIGARGDEGGESAAGWKGVDVMWPFGKRAANAPSPSDGMSGWNDCKTVVRADFDVGVITVTVPGMVELRWGIITAERLAADIAAAVEAIRKRSGEDVAIDIMDDVNAEVKDG